MNKEVEKMLKNKTERKNFIEDISNWKKIYDLPELAMKVYETILPDGKVIYKYVVREEYSDNYYIKGVHIKIKHRMKIGDHVSEEVSMTYLVDLLGKVK